MAKIMLTPERVAELRTAQRNLHDILPEIDRAESCGIECDSYRTMVEQAHEKVTQLLSTYGGQ